ncbi:MAG: delta-60 repeat domain-containing protein [Algoriphagus sp.]|uniref:delta-60 repeat domain-containing protein n=1 Tax=Algoriphagus sp. TaxID=1872435 RepID=UPI002734748A|nr:delta-60 repeat domain-containing protein [Algoriphagus sp.]MDP3471598.1 delta-60 repeat domain-containing protein [Algoriphagus sp.]
MKKSIIKILIWFLPLTAWAQDAEETVIVEPPSIGPNGLVLSHSFLRDSKILIAGEFTTFDGIPAGRIARIDSEGVFDPTFNSKSGANGSVFSTIVQDDGKILICGDFTSYNGVVKNKIARLNDDGSLDVSYNEGEGPDNSVLSMAILPDEKILIGGSFDFFNGIERKYFARLNSNGSLDNTFYPGTGVNDKVYNISVQQDGKILIGGDFTSHNGVSVNRIIRLNQDGSLDNSFDIGTGADNSVKAIAVQSDGKILIAGDFLSFDGNKINRIARLNNDGSIDASFNSGAGANNSIWNIVIESDGKILIHGSFSTYNGSDKNSLAKLNNDGSLDTSF